MFGVFKAGTPLWEFQVDQRDEKVLFTKDTGVAK